MTKTTKRLLTAAVILLISGLGLCLLAAALAGFDLTRLDTEESVGRTQTISEPFDSLSIDLASHAVRLLPAEDGLCRVIWRENTDQPLRAAVEDGVLRVSQPGLESFHFLSFSWGWADYTLTVYLPGESYRDLTVRTTSGDVELPADFRFQTLRLESTSGDLVCLAQADESLSMESTSGDLTLSGAAPARAELSTTSGSITLSACRVPVLEAGAVSGDIRLEGCRGESLRLSATSGSLKLVDTAFSGPARLDTVSGEIELDAFDAGSLTASATSGSVTGTLSGGKVFRYETVSGRVSLPAPDPGGGDCFLETVSGDIDLKYTN